MPRTKWQKKKSAVADDAQVAIKETDPRRLEQRQKQIDFGKNTLGYDRYIAAVPKTKRRRFAEEHPVTPDKSAKISKRCWDGRVRAWRRLLHRWDNFVPEGEGSAAVAVDSDGDVVERVGRAEETDPGALHEKETTVDTRAADAEAEAAALADDAEFENDDLL
jgi:hypothetical protein